MASSQWPPTGGWKTKSMHDTEEKLRSANEKVGKLSLENAEQLLTISRIYNIATLGPNKPDALFRIKALIEQSNIRFADVSGLPTLLPCTSPIWSTHSASSRGASNFESTTSGTEDSDESGLTDSVCGTMEGSGIRDGDDAHASTTTVLPTTVDKNDTADEEFSLEEELAGIADAPAENRAAMRAALRDEQNARKKMLQQSADEKRKIAEREGRQMKKGIPKPLSLRTAQPTAVPIRPLEAVQAKHRAPETPEMPETPMRTRVDDDGDTDGDDEAKFDIISVASSSPKATGRFGIIFDPSKLDATTTAQISGAPESSDTCRSVLIENIPSDFTLHRLLAYVRGGTIVTARLIPDYLNTGQGQMALITFKTAQEAEKCCGLTGKLVSISRTHASICSDLASDIRIYRLPTPTYPTREAVPVQGDGMLGLSNQQEPTRCISIDSFPRRYVHMLCNELSLGIRQFPTRVHALEEMWFEGETLNISFTSIKEAEKAYKIIGFFCYGKFVGQLHYRADPCATDADTVDGALNDVEVASSGSMGLKSLLETVGLGAYSKSQADAPSGKAQENATRSQASDTQPQVSAPTDLASKDMKGQASSLLLDIFGNGGHQEEATLLASTLTSAVDSSGTIKLSTTPWTADLMEGLECL